MRHGKREMRKVRKNYTPFLAGMATMVLLIGLISASFAANGDSKAPPSGGVEPAQVGVGVFLMIAMLRIVFRVKLSYIMIVFYAAAFILSIFVPHDFWAVSFDAGGVTTGPMTVPFIMSLGVGVASIRSDKKGQDDSFGLVALSSVGPIIAVLVLGIVFNVSDVPYEMTVVEEVIKIGLIAISTSNAYLPNPCK